MSDRPPWAHAYYARRTVDALRLFAEAPRSSHGLADSLQVSVKATRRLIWMLADDGLIEEHPDLRHQYRLAAGGYAFGLLLLSSGLRALEHREDAFTVGQTLARYRRSRGMSQGDLAANLGVSLSHLTRIERGQREVDGREVVEFASRLDVDVLDLLTLRRSATAMAAD
jgi:DNA-binding XRE family transcriptional regulator